jgi:peptidoglycan L-alanyl-D-glutamate endopeptidase CwlK
MDLITYDRIKFLHPKIRKEVRELYDKANKELPQFVRLRFAYTLRTFDEQDALFRQGRSVFFDKNGKRLGRVTNAKAGQSIHNYGLAFDIVILEDRDKNGTFESANYLTNKNWMAVINFFKAAGFAWGGDWKFVDPPHLEKTFGLTWRDLKVKLDSGDFFEEVIDGKKYKYVNI